MSNEADRIRSVIAANPQNVTAAKALARGIHYDPQINFDGRTHWKNCPPIRPFPFDARNPQLTDFTGKRFGRLVVIGCSSDVRQDGTRWVVRCSCGNYEVRKTKTLKAAKEVDACCIECNDLKWKQERYKKLGSRPFSDFHPQAPNDGGKT